MAGQKKRTALDYFKQEAAKTEEDIKTVASGEKINQTEEIEPSSKKNEIETVQETTTLENVEISKQEESVKESEDLSKKVQEIEPIQEKETKYKDVFKPVSVVEPVKQNISKRHNQMLKALSLAENSSIANILHNIIQNWFDENQKQVKQSLKKNMF